MGSTDRQQPVRWASRVPAQMVQRLYEGQARGLLDEDLLEDVFLRIYARCLSIIDVTEATRGRIRCPVCRTTIELPIDSIASRTSQGNCPIICPKCPWRSTWAAFSRSFEDKHLLAEGTEPHVHAFVTGVSTVRTPIERMLLIDTLIHGFAGQPPQTPASPIALSIIEGTLPQIAAIMEGLPCGTGTSAEMLANRRHRLQTWHPT